MANGIFKRGEMYWFKFGDSMGSEMAAGRPGVIISSNKGNEAAPTLLIAMVTRQAKYLSIDVKTVVGGIPRWIMCNQVMTVDKSRSGDFIGALSKAEMDALDTALEETFDLGYVDDSKDEELTELREKVKANEDTVSSMKMEIEMWKKCYERAMDMLVDVKVNADYSLRTAKLVEPPKEPERVIDKVEIAKIDEPVKVDEPERVEINTCTAEDLKRCGCSPVVIENIINSRPYMNLDELRVVNGVTSVAYGILKHKLCCVPVKVEEPEQKIEEPEVVVEVVEQEAPVDEPVVEPAVLDKVNVNTASAKEISTVSGMHINYCYYIVKYRKDNGPFAKLDELLNVKLITPGIYAKYKDRLTTGEPESPPEEPEKAKLNVNTATAEEIVEYTRMSHHTAKNIVAYRKKNGPFRDITDLLQVTRFGNGCMELYGHMLTVGEPEEEQQESGKVNINTANMYDLMGVGFEKRAAALIVNERKKYGRFRSVDDLAKISEISGKILRKLRDKLEV